MASNEVGSQTEFCKCIKTRLQKQLGNENRYCPRCRKPIYHQKNSHTVENQNRPAIGNKDNYFSSSDNSNLHYETIKHSPTKPNSNSSSQLGIPDPRGEEEILDRGSYNPSPRLNPPSSPENNLSRTLRELSFSPVEVKTPQNLLGIT